MYIVAGLLAAAVSWAGNRAALKLIGTKVIIISAPLLEELAKSGISILLNTSLVLTHGVFGIVEGLYDAWGSGFRGIKAGIISFSGHFFYGYVTYLVLSKYDLFFAAVLAGYLVHTLWNIAVMKFMVTKKRRVSY